MACDALAHYIMMTYEIANADKFRQELKTAESNYSKNSNYIKMARIVRGVNFEKDVINKLTNTIGNPTNFMRYLQSLIRKGLIAYDDYSIAMFNKYKKKDGSDKNV